VETAEIIRRIASVRREIANVGDVRPGHLSIQYRRSGTRNVKEIGYNQLSYTFGGRSRTEYVRDEDLARVRREVAEFHRFRKLCDEFVALSIELSKARTEERIESEEA